MKLKESSITLILFYLFSLAIITATMLIILQYVNQRPQTEIPHIKQISQPQSMDKLFGAMRIVESANGTQMNGALDEYGPYHIREIYVDDINRIIGWAKYKYEDRLNETKSREMICLYWEYYATARRLGREPEWEDLARIHNGGPNGYKIRATVSYWEKIKQHL